ncbi:hypothetical protein MJO28_009385 [Puccinia striiformis f. sp. tritici]|uniref:Uncharacterized protein n=1 Tax=Puccinia striiformis f. sp. tritici TaxID=168172 RepID=A0ACC0E892_9BASI|nr:hypothetical protein MJO28_009385 [Puccinia striiformis f. sp. tritici]
MLLDPRIKLRYFEKNYDFLVEHDISTLQPSDILQRFKGEACSSDQSPSKLGQASSPPKQIQTPKKLSIIEADIFGQGPVAKDLDDEIQQYLLEPNAKQKCDILCFWSQQKKVYPSLAAMAACFLGIPATSAPSEREWYQSSDRMMDTSSVNLPVATNKDNPDDSDSDQDEDQ